MQPRSRRSMIVTLLLVATVVAFSGAAPAEAKPELLVSSAMPLSVTACTPGRAVLGYLVTIENLGDAVTPSIPLKDALKIQDEHAVGWESSEAQYDYAVAGHLSQIPPKAKRQVRIYVPYLASNPDHMWDVPTHRFLITVDPNNVVDEAYEQNNTRPAPQLPDQLAHCAPDLAIVSAQFVRTAAGGYADVTVRNDGGRPVQRFAVAIVNTKATAGRQWLATWSQGRLQNGQTATVKVIRSDVLDEREPEPGGKPRPPVPRWTDFSCLNAIVDPNNQVTETKEYNNQARCIPVTGGGV